MSNSDVWLEKLFQDQQEDIDRSERFYDHLCESDPVMRAMCEVLDALPARSKATTHLENAMDVYSEEQYNASNH